jgi:DNA replication ATP-dependent helicase Dna2
MLEQILQRPQMQLDMWAAELGMEEVRLEVWEKATAGLLGFGQRWIGPTPLDDSTLHNSMSRLSVSGLHDIEESIWSPKWGMKGKVDASVHAHLIPGKPSKSVYQTAMGPVEDETEDRPMPFEIKTGRAVGVMEHRAQTMLYTLLMEERYRKAFSTQLLRCQC